MPEIEEAILTKIQKLLNLKVGAEQIGSLHEAENAAIRVTELLLKYNLELEDVTGFVKPDAKDIRRFNEEGIINPKNEGKWIHALYNILCKYNFCKMITNTSKYNTKADYAILIGTKDNVESVKFLAEQLEARIRTAEKGAWTRNNSREKRNTFRRGFFQGAVFGIHSQLMEKRAMEQMQNNKVTALVLSRDTKLKEFIQNEFSRLTQGKANRGLSGANGHSMGYETGKNMNINKGVEGTISNKYLN